MSEREYKKLKRLRRLWINRKATKTQMLRCMEMERSAEYKRNHSKR